MKQCFKIAFQKHPRLDPLLTDDKISTAASAEICATAMKRVLMALRRAKLYPDKKDELWIVCTII